MMNTSAAFAVGLVVLLALAVVLLLMAAEFAPLPQLGFAHDIGIMLDAGWRFTQGQMPHRDYSSPLGPAYALMVGVPLKLGGVEYASYRLLPTFVGCAFMFACFAVAWARLPAWAAVFYSVLVGIVAGGTYHMGWPAEWTSFATFFNRQGWAAVMILAVGYCVPGVQEGKIADIVAGVVSGLLLGALLFFKINFFMAGALLVAAGFVMRIVPFRGPLAWSGLVGFLLAAFAFLQSISWDVTGMIRDLTYAAEARRLSFVSAEKYWNPGTKLVSNALGLMLVFALCLAAALRRNWRACATSAFLALLGYGLMNTNSSGNGAGIPLLVTALVVGTLLLFNEATSSRDEIQAKVLAWGAALALGVATLLIPQVSSWIVWRAASEAIRQRQFPAFDEASGSMNGFAENGNNDWREQFTPMVKEGTALVKQHVPKDKTLLYIDFTNVFNFAAEARSPRFTMLWYDEYGTFARSERGHPDPESFFSDVDYVMLPKRPFSNDGIGIWLDIYEAYLKARYELSAESANFWLFLRKAS
jgi:hypothetical protein